MKTLLLLAGAVALASAGPAFARPPHAGPHGKGRGAVPAHVGQFGLGSQYGYGLGGCPPGLAKQNPQCMPPGLHRQLFAVGQRVPYGYQGLLGYNALPYDLRSRYGGGLDPYSRYIYRDDYLYRVDPTTMIVSEILRAVL